MFLIRSNPGLFVASENCITLFNGAKHLHKYHGPKPHHRCGAVSGCFCDTRTTCFSCKTTTKTSNSVVWQYVTDSKKSANFELHSCQTASGELSHSCVKCSW